MTYNALDISKYVINRCYEIGSDVTNLKLQKLLYYIQAAFLVEKGVKCFNEKILAWNYGPVVREVYDEYKMFGRSNIPAQGQNERAVFNLDTFEIKLEKIDTIINEDDKKIIDKILCSYSEINDPFELVRKTHAEDPWNNGRKEGIISEDDMKSYYSAKRNQLYNI